MADPPRFPKAGVFDNSALFAYLNAHPTTDEVEHLADLVDPASGRGAFGNEYNGWMPCGQWLITKADLLVAQSAGYTLRSVDCFSTVAFATTALPSGRAGQAYAADFVAVGGVPAYDWTVSDGAAPAGLTLDRYTGKVAGYPTQTGTFELIVQLRDSTRDTAGITRAFTIRIDP